MDVHLELGIQRLLDLKPENIKMTASVTGAEDHGPCIEDDLKLESGGGCENWADGSKAGRDLQTAVGFPRRFQRSTGRS